MYRSSDFSVYIRAEVHRTSEMHAIITTYWSSQMSTYTWRLTFHMNART